MTLQRLVRQRLAQPSRPAAQAAQAAAVPSRSTNSRVVGGSNTALARKARAGAVLQGPARTAPAGRQGFLDPHKLQQTDEQLETLAEGAEGLCRPREQRLLEGEPVL